MEVRETAVNYSATNHCTYLLGVILICLMTSNFISTTLAVVTLFSRIKNLENTCKRFYNSQSFWRDLVSCNGENWQYLKDTLALCVRIGIETCY